MKKFIILSLLLLQCSPLETEIQPTSVDIKDFGEQIIELSDLPFVVVTPANWHLENTGSESQLWQNSELQLVIQHNSDIAQIPDESEVISSVENSRITSFCIAESCVIQMDEEGLFEVQVLSEAGREVLKRLR